MKKVIIVLFFLTIILINKKEEEFIIPDNAIRFRVIANSNSFEDQATKVEIKNNVENIVKKDLLLTKNKQEAQKILNESIPKIKNMVDNYNITYNINYGNNYFPEKKYKGITYQEGYYESLVLTLGNGKGDNWWCLMFPPLCLMETENNDLKNVDYQFFVKDIFNKYM